MDSKLVFSFFNVFMFSVATGECWSVVGRGIGVENSDIQLKMSVQIDHPKNHPLRAMSDRAPSSVFADRAENVSPVMGWRVGSMETL